MAQASLSRSWHQLSRTVHRSALQWLELPAIQPIARSAVVSRRWLGSGAALLVLLLWNWRLMVSLGLGLATLMAGYLLQQGQGKRLGRIWQQWWQTVDRPFVLTIASSLLVMGASYLALSIWQELESSWLAIGFLLQGAAVLAVLGLLLWQWRQFQSDRAVRDAAIDPAIDPDWLSDLLQDLADADPLKRLLAVRQLTHALTQADLPLLITPSELAESFRLMLNRETEAIVCRALLESLQVLDAIVPSLPASSQPEVQMTQQDILNADRRRQTARANLI